MKMSFLRNLFGKPEKTVEKKSITPKPASPVVQNVPTQVHFEFPALKNARWEFYWDGSVAEKEQKARDFFKAAKKAILEEFKSVLPCCMLLAYEDLAQAHYYVQVFFEQYSSNEADKPGYFVECVVKRGGPEPDRLTPYILSTTISAEKWYTDQNNATFGIPPGCGGYRIADTFFSK
jgi:hypothetical protein